MDDREEHDVDSLPGEWSTLLSTETAESSETPWLTLVRGAESDFEAEPAEAATASVWSEDTGVEFSNDDRLVEAFDDGIEIAEGVEGQEADVQGRVGAGALNLKCGHVGFYGVLGRRRPVYDTTAIPYRWICQLIITRRDSNNKTTMVAGTGVLISPRHVLTAAHWIKWADKDDRNLWVTYETTGVFVIPGRSSEERPLGATYASKMRVASGWNPKNQNPSQNYALLELDTPLGDGTPAALGDTKLCYWGSPQCPGAVVRVVSESDLGQLQGNGGMTAGYSDSRHSMRQYESRGGITHVNPGWFMRIAAHPWEGGSPVWINERGEHQLIGLMLKSGEVLRITKPMCEELRGWIGTPICSGKTATSITTTKPKEIDYESYERADDNVFGPEETTDSADQPPFEGIDGDEVVTIGPESLDDYEGGIESAGATPARARILWPALGFPAVIAPGGKTDAEATRCITLLVLSNQRTLTPEQVAQNLRCVPWAERRTRHIPANFFTASDVTVLTPKTSFTTKNPSQAQLVEFGGTGATVIRASLATAVRDRYAKELPFLHEIRISEARSSKLTDGLYHLFWNNAGTGADAPSDEMAFLLAHYARPKVMALGPLSTTHDRYLMDEYEYEYGSLHKPYCSPTGTRVRAEILHPLFVDRAGRPTLKIGQLTDLHVDVRADVYGENVRTWASHLNAKSSGKKPLSADEQSLLTTLGLYNNWNKSVVALYDDAKQDANAILLTGDLIDYGRGHWGQDAAAHLEDIDLYTPDRNWFLFQYLIASGDAYTKPVYTNLGNHDWRINPYPPFAIGGPSPQNFFYKERQFQSTLDAEKKLRKWEEERAKKALQAAHGDGHKRKFSYEAKAEGKFALFVEKTGDSIKALIEMLGQTQTMNVEGTPSRTTVASVEWYLLSINPFFDYAFTLPNQHRVLMLDWAELENVLFPIIEKGRSRPYMIWQASEAADPGPKAKSSVTPLQQDLVTGFLKLPGHSKVIGVHAPPIGPYPDWSDKDMLAGRTNYGKEKAEKARGGDFVTKRPDGTEERWYGHPLFATQPKSGMKGVTADYGSLDSKRDWFIENVGDPRGNVRVVMSGHIHRNGAYVVHLLGNEMGPALAGERIVYRVKASDASNVSHPAVSRTPQGKRGPLYVNTTSAGPNGNYHPAADWGAKTYPGYARVHLAENGTIELVQFRKLGAPGGQRAASPGFAELQLKAG